MSNLSSIKIDGLKAIEKALSKLPEELQRTTEMAALRDGAKPILAASKNLAKQSEDEGDLMRSLGINVRKGKSGSTRGIYTARIGARKGFSRVVGTYKSRCRSYGIHGGFCPTKIRSFRHWKIPHDGRDQK